MLGFIKYAGCCFYQCLSVWFLNLFLTYGNHPHLFPMIAYTCCFPISVTRNRLAITGSFIPSNYQSVQVLPGVLPTSHHPEVLALGLWTPGAHLTHFHLWIALAMQTSSSCCILLGEWHNNLLHAASPLIVSYRQDPTGRPSPMPTLNSAV